MPPVIGVELNWGGGGKAGVTKRGRKGEQLISCPIQYDYEGERKAESIEMPLRGDRRRWWHWPSWSFFPASLSSSPRRRRRRWRSRWKNVRRAWTALRSCTLDSSFAFTRMWMWQHSSWGTAGGGYQDESERGNYALQLIHEMWFNSWTLCRMVEGEGRAPVTCHALPGIQCSHSCNETFTRFESNRNMNCEEEKSATSHQVWKLQLDQWIPLWYCASSLSLPRHVWCWQV